MSLLCDAGLLKASVGQRRHLAQCAEPRGREGAGVHGQADRDEPIRQGRDASGRERFPADFSEPTAWDRHPVLLPKPFHTDLVHVGGNILLGLI